MIANRNTASLECDIMLQFASTANTASRCHIHTFSYTITEEEKKKKGKERRLAQHAAIRATVYYNKRVHMLKKELSNFTFACPISPVASLCYLANWCLHEGQPVVLQSASSLLPPVKPLPYGELSCAEPRRGDFIVMQISVTIKNIILGDVSGVITHMARSQLSSRWISPFNWARNFSARCFMLCTLSTFCWTIR